MDFKLPLGKGLTRYYGYKSAHQIHTIRNYFHIRLFRTNVYAPKKALLPHPTFFA
jgi:hypothetical protein